MIIISRDAQNHFISLLSKEPKETHIRVFIVNPGTPMAECGLSYCVKQDIEKSDIEFKYDNFCIYVNKDLVTYLKHAEIDLVSDKLGTQLTLKAPYAKLNESSKDSYLLEDKIKYFLNVEINPHLSMHGGRVNLIEVDQNNKTVIIQFSGGCNGCSMIGITLKETVEKKLLAAFPEITKVYDRTDHFHGQHSFY